MKIIAAVLVLALLSSTHAFMVFPQSGKMSDLRDTYQGFVEGIGATHDNIEISENCFGDITKENLAAILDELMNLEMTSRISDLLPLFESMGLLLTDLYKNCEVATLLNHILAHSQITSATDFGMNLLQESHHLQHLAADMKSEATFEFIQTGRILGEAVGVILGLRGVEKVPHN